MEALEDRCLLAGFTEFPIPTATTFPYGITSGPDGNLWFAEPLANQLGRITPAGAITEFPVPTASSQPGGITAGPDGNLWFTEFFYTADKIGRITPGGAITEFPVPTISYPYAITAGPDGNLWFTETSANQIGRITPAGTITEFPISMPGFSILLGDITAGPDGNLWFAETTADKIGRITPGGTITEFTVPTAGSQPIGITSGPDGNLWFAESSANKIGRITPAGAITEFPTPTAGSGPIGITASPDGNLWFTEFYGDRLGRITPAGVITEFPIPTAGSGPNRITVGPDGNLWFTEYNANKIGRFGLPKFKFTEATTEDADSVTVDYTISTADITQPLEFDVYRSDQPFKDSTSQFLGEQTIDPSNDSQDLTQGDHEVTLIKGTSLPINPFEPYIIVVANPNHTVQESPDSVNTAYFRKFVLGVVSHGYSPFGDLTGLPEWETSAYSDHLSIDNYNDVIEFDWLSQSRVKQPGITIAQGQILAEDIRFHADALVDNLGHPGDVVDLHLIGHSRGTVVVTQALLDLEVFVDPLLTGGYKKVTLLDPHPANNSFATKDYSSGNSLFDNFVMVPSYKSFQAVAVDPQVVIPSNINEAEIYYQHTIAQNFSVFNSEGNLNLRGEDPSIIINFSSAPVYVLNLTDFRDPTLGFIGHSEVPLYYENNIIKSGKSYL